MKHIWWRAVLIAALLTWSFAPALSGAGQAAQIEALGWSTDETRWAYCLSRSGSAKLSCSVYDPDQDGPIATIVDSREAALARLAELGIDGKTRGREALKAPTATATATGYLQSGVEQFEADLGTECGSHFLELRIERAADPERPGGEVTGLNVMYNQGMQRFTYREERPTHRLDSYRLIYVSLSPSCKKVAVVVEGVVTGLGADDGPAYFGAADWTFIPL